MQHLFVVCDTRVLYLLYWISYLWELYSKFGQLLRLHVDACVNLFSLFFFFKKKYESDCSVLCWLTYYKTSFWVCLCNLFFKFYLLKMKKVLQMTRLCVMHLGSKLELATSLRPHLEYNTHSTSSWIQLDNYWRLEKTQENHLLRSQRRGTCQGRRKTKRQGDIFQPCYS